MRYLRSEGKSRMLITQPHGDAVPGTAADALRGRLVEALRCVTSDLSPAELHSRLVGAACDLVGATDGALAILGGDGGVQHVVAQGAGSELVAGRSDDRTQLIVALDVRGELYATLHVAAPVRCANRAPARDPREGVAGVEAGHEEVLAALTDFAAMASTAIENAQRYDDARRSRDWLSASGEIARALLTDADADALLDVVSRALHAAEADLGSLIVPTEDGRLRVAISVGVGADDWEGQLVEPERSAAGRAMARGERLLLPDIAPVSALDFVNVHRYGPTMLAPLTDAKGVRGAVVLIRLAGRPRFTPRELDLATAFADQLALAFELSDMRDDAEALRTLQDRHRIAQDLHDNVMQRLFAMGVGLHGLVDSPALPAGVADRLRKHVADLDETIDEIRDSVFGLRSGAPSGARPSTRFPRVPADQRQDERPGSE
jgi:signal transduction histidine kinase